VRRVLASAMFAQTRQLKVFLAYVCERALDDAPESIDDSEIGSALWKGRPFDARAGKIIRGQASLLRKRLLHYFATEGAGEPMVIELALGTYLPIFRPRGDGHRRTPEGHADGEAPQRWLRFVAAALFVLAGAALGALWTSARARSTTPGGTGEVERLWRQMFANGRPTDLVLSDANVTLFQDLVGQTISVGDYERGRLNALMEERLEPGSDAQHLAGRSLEQRHVPMGDVILATRVLGLHAALGLPMEVLFARDASLRGREPRNVILSGPRRANPWLELYEPRLNFRSRFDTTRKIAAFENKAPLSGEPAHYAAAWNVRGYCRVAYLPTLDGRATALIVSGSDMTSTEAGALFVTSERSLRELRGRLRVSADDVVPYFEVLLSTALVVGGTSSAPELVAQRVIVP
jgi:hypothetical protein